MILDLKEVKKITLGAVSVTEDEGGFNFHRFTDEQEELYKKRLGEDCKKIFSTSGVQLSFRTNSEELSISTCVTPGSSRQYFAFDVFSNGKKIGSLDNFSSEKLPRDYTCSEFSLGNFEKIFSLGQGEKDVCIYFPWSVKATLKELRIDDNAFTKPMRPKNKLLCFGDSITHGYDALYPSNKYISRLASFLSAEEINKAVGGEVFFPELAGAKEDFIPDYISVAYGTNDWNCLCKKDFTKNCADFFENLKANYPETKIFVITPIWRKNYDEKRDFGDFDKVEKIIRDIVGKYENIKVISGFDLVPHDDRLFADLRLHPNDEGFAYYFENLSKNIEFL